MTAPISDKSVILTYQYIIDSLLQIFQPAQFNNLPGPLNTLFNAS